MTRDPDWVELVESARAGDGAARGALLHRFSPLARATARRLVDTDHDVDDVVQDAFTEVLGSLSQLRTPQAFPAWLRLIVRKHAGRRRRGLERQQHVVSPEYADADTVPDMAAEKKEVIALVRAGLSTLADQDRRLLELRYFAGWTTADLAQVLDIGEGAVRKRLHDARQRLRPALRNLHEPKDDAMNNLTDYLDQVHAAHNFTVASNVALRRPEPLVPTPTGLKIIDAMAPVVRGGTIEITGAIGTGHLVVALELLQRLGRTESETVCVAVGPRAAEDDPFDLSILTTDDSVEHDRHAVVLAEPGEDASAAVQSAANLAAGLADTGNDVVLVLDRRVLDPSADLSALAGHAATGSVTVIVTSVFPRRGPLPASASLAVDTRLVLSLEQFVAGIFPAIDPVASSSVFGGVGSAAAVREHLAQAERLRRYFAQPMHASAKFTGDEPTWVSESDADTQLQALLV